MKPYVRFSADSPPLTSTSEDAAISFIRSHQRSAPNEFVPSPRESEPEQPQQTLARSIPPRTAQSCTAAYCHRAPERGEVVRRCASERPRPYLRGTGAPTASDGRKSSRRSRQREGGGQAAEGRARARCRRGEERRDRKSVV